MKGKYHSFSKEVTCLFQKNTANLNLEGILNLYSSMHKPYILIRSLSPPANQNCVPHGRTLSRGLGVQACRYQ